MNFENKTKIIITIRVIIKNQKQTSNNGRKLFIILSLQNDHVIHSTRQDCRLIHFSYEYKT